MGFNTPLQQRMYYLTIIYNQLKIYTMYYETNCTAISIDKWDMLMKGNKAANKKRVIKAALQTGIIDNLQANEEIKKPYFNPYEHRQTKTHYIYIHSAIEYFIHK